VPFFTGPKVLVAMILDPMLGMPIHVLFGYANRSLKRRF
jgi:hypothetical protein